jgi:large subunit ribosomal protein L47
MARIKYVINERRLLYEKYAAELEAKRQVLASKPTPATAEAQPSQEKGRVSRAERLKARRAGRTVAPSPV